MRARRTAFAIALLLNSVNSFAATPKPLPRVADGWTIELVKEAPEILFPTAIVSNRSETLFLGQDPMDMPGPPTVPNDSVVSIDRGGKVTVFADKLWAVMGLEFEEASNTLFVVHPPFLSAFRDTNNDGKADRRVDLMTGLGPNLPGFSGINDHVASGVRLGMDGFLYIAVGDKGIPHGVGKDGASIQLFGGGVIRIKTDGTGLEVVSTGESNPLSVALTATDEVFTYGNDDDSKQWPNSLTHHIVGGHYGYPYEFLRAPTRALPIMAGQFGGSGAQAICYEECGLPEEYRGNLFVCDWGLQTVFRYTIKRKGGTFEVLSRTPLVSKGELGDFRPFSLCVGDSGTSLYLVDWSFNGWLADGPKTGRLYRLRCNLAVTAPPPLVVSDLAMLDHPARSERLNTQRLLVSDQGAKAVGPLISRLRKPEPRDGRLHAIWALDAIDEPLGRAAIREVMADPDEQVRLQAVRSAGISRDQKARPAILTLLKDQDAAVRREAAIALGQLGDKSAGPALMDALGDTDTFVAWSVRHAIRTLNAWNAESVKAALLDPKRREDALKLCDEAWASPVVEALTMTITKVEPPEARAKVAATLAGLYRKYPKWSGNWFGTNPLAGSFPQKTEEWDPPAMAKIRHGLTVAIHDSSAIVRLQGIAGLLMVGKLAVPVLRASLTSETDPRNLVALAEGLGVLGDFGSAPALGAIVSDADKPEAVRIAALDALGNLRGPQALTARIAIVYDPKAPASLVARALPALGREGIIPPNDLAGFLEHADPAIRASALRALTARKNLPDEVRQSVLMKLDDPSVEVRNAAVEAVVALKMSEAVPRLLTAALKPETKREATIALASLADPRALPVYLNALGDRDPEVRKRAEAALLVVRDSVRPDIEAAARKGKFEGQAALAIERVLSQFKPLTDWNVIGPFARTTARVFVGESSIDFSRTQSGAEGRTIAWAPRRADPETGRVILDDFKAGAGDRGGFGYDTNGSPDLCAFGFAEIDSEGDREALMLVGSSGSLSVTVNEREVFTYRNLAGRAYRPDSDLVRLPLKRGKNRVLVVTRQGLGVWSFGVQVAEPSSVLLARGRAKSFDPEVFRAFAAGHKGDPKGGESLFFDAKGIGCVKCHAANGKGTAKFGPDLTGLALKYDKAEIIRSVLDPSNRIANGYQPVVLATRDGKVITGVVRSESVAHVELFDSETRVTRVAKPDIQARNVGDVSVMPTGLVDSLSPVEFADLISYLQTLKLAR